jgi:hypothetical protein
MNYLRFFLGTPRRLLASLVVIGVFIAGLWPNVLAIAIQDFMIAIQPLISSVLTIIIILFGLKVATRMIWSGGGKKNHKRG